MIDKLLYYIELFITLCGFDGNKGSGYLGFTAVIISAAIVIYSLYFAVSRTLWPDPDDGYPAKYNILDDKPGASHAD